MDTQTNSLDALLGDKGKRVFDKSEENTQPDAPAPDAKVDDQPSEFNFSETFGEQYDSPDTIKQHLEEYNKLAEQSKSWSEKEQEYKQQLTQQNNPYADEQLYVLNELAKKTESKDLATLSVIASKAYDEMADLDVVVLKRMQDEGISKKDAIDFVKDEYGLDIEPDFYEDMSDEEKEREQKRYDRDKRLAERKLSVEAKKAKVDFDNLTKDMKMPEVQELDMEKVNAERQKKYDEAVTGWSQVYDKVTEGGGKMTYQIPGKDGKLEDFIDYEFDSEIDKQLRDEVVDIMAQGGYQYNEEALGTMTEYIQTRKTLMNLPNIIKVAADKARSMATEDFDKKYNNPSGVKNSDKNIKGNEGNKRDSELNRLLQNT